MRTLLLSVCLFTLLQTSCTRQASQSLTSNPQDELYPSNSKSKSKKRSNPAFAPTERVYERDPVLGCFYLNEKGEKVATVDGNCDLQKPPATQSHIPTSKSANGYSSGSNSNSSAGNSSYNSSSTNYTGPRGGTYHYTKSGKKSYYKRKK